ncbi:MinD/ParA family protein [Candidatus Woesearchaeota archaeon]|nr:MinD/ParA family protein [Candidatus Woesearchaeota archaeon]
MGNGKTISIISIKGGVGKTTTTVNLGAILAKDFNQKVLLVDGNLSSPNLGDHIGIINPDFTLKDVLMDKIGASGAIYKHELGFDVIPSTFTPNADRFSVFKLKEKLLKIKRNYDFVLIDSSPNLNNEMLLAMVAANELIVVTTPDTPTLRCTIEAVEVAKQQKTPISGLIINKQRGKRFEVTKKDLESQTKVPVLAVLPDDIKILESLSKTTPLPYYSPKTKVTKMYHNIAKHIMGETENSVVIKQPFKSRVKNFLNRYITIESGNQPIKE